MTKDQVKQRITAIRKQMRDIDHAYYVLDKPIVSDAARDSLKAELSRLEKEYPELITSDSPTQRIGGKALGKFGKYRHQTPKYSLEDVFSFDAIIEFDQRIKRFLNLPADKKIEYVCELKIDGLNMSVLYVDGLLDKAVTRGDGKVGEVVTHTVKTIGSIPLSLSQPVTAEIGGEVYMPSASFARMNEEQVAKGEASFANPRNAAAGTIRQLDPQIAANRDLGVFMWALFEAQKFGAKTHSEALEIIKSWGGRVNPQYRTVSSIEEAIKYCETWSKKRDKLDYQIDGIVIKVNDLALQERLGRTAKCVRWAVAYKFPAEQSTSVVEAISVQVGRTGALTPVAHLTPVQLAGTVVRRATLHNQDEIDRLDVRIGDTVVVQKAGDIIPDIIQTLPKMRTGKEKRFKMPTKCPACGSPVIKHEGEVASYCSNPDCFAQQSERLSYFVSRRAFDIVGLGPKILEALQGVDLIKSPADIFILTVDDLLTVERFAQKSAENLIASIAAKKKINLAKYINALGIRHVGEETAVLMAQHFGSLAKWQQAEQDKLEQIAGVGPVVAESVYRWLHTPANQELMNQLAERGVTVETAKKASGALVGQTFVLTGEMESLSRDEASDLIRSLGGHTSSSVSVKTDYVVAGDNPGSKYKKAQQLGVKIVDEKGFLKLVGKGK